MKVFRVVGILAVLWGMLIVFSATLANADQFVGNDPRIIIGGDPPSAPAGIITLDFVILTPSGTSPGTSACILNQGSLSTTSPSCLFENDISINGVGETIYSLTFNAVGIDANTVNCGFLAGSPFSGCGVDPLPNGQGAQVTFTGGMIPFHNDFTLGFETFPENFELQAEAGLAPVPEPGTVALLLSGMGIVALWIRRTSWAGDEG
jgi:hypothetical protein